MLLKKSFAIHEQLKKALGDDLVFSLAISEGTYVLTVSVHKSTTWKFSHGKNFQQCIFTKDDMDRKIDKIVYFLVLKFKEILVPRPPEEDPNNIIEELNAITADNITPGRAGDPEHIFPGSDF